MSVVGVSVDLTHTCGGVQNILAWETRENGGNGVSCKQNGKNGTGRGGGIVQARPPHTLEVVCVFSTCEEISRQTDKQKIVFNSYAIITVGLIAYFYDVSIKFGLSTS